MEARIGVNLRVTAHSDQGGRKYMEDVFSVAYQPTSDKRDLLYAYFGIFDGHGGGEAAMFAQEHLMNFIVSQKNFWADDDELVMKAIREGFMATHYAMWKESERWPKTASGLPSTAGTTASILFVRRGKMYIGHAGDSGIVLGEQDPNSGYWRAKPLTRGHKPESPAENARIIQSGGKVVAKSGVPRVVWNRPQLGHKGPVRRSTHIVEIPFLAIARSLGDVWSYNPAQKEFVVSPVPDVSVIDLDVNSHRCIILGSDGLWDMLTPQDAVHSVYYAESNNEKQLLSSPPGVSSSQVENWINPSERLVNRALNKWFKLNLRADNTSAVTVIIDPPGPPNTRRILLERKLDPHGETTRSFAEAANAVNTCYSVGSSKHNKSNNNNSSAAEKKKNPVRSPSNIKSAAAKSSSSSTAVNNTSCDARSKSSYSVPSQDDVQVHEISSSKGAKRNRESLATADPAGINPPKRRRVADGTSSNGSPCETPEESSQPRQTRQSRVVLGHPHDSRPTLNGIQMIPTRSRTLRRTPATAPPAVAEQVGQRSRASGSAKRPKLNTNETPQAPSPQPRTLAKAKLTSVSNEGLGRSLRSGSRAGKRVTRSMK